MARSYSEDLRERALLRADAGETIREIAAVLQISPSCVSKWRKLRTRTGALTPGQVGGHKKRTLSGERAQWLRERIAAVPFTSRGLTAELVARGIRTDRRAVWTFLKAEGLSFKKKPCCRRNSHVRISPGSEHAGRLISTGLIPDASSFSTRHGSRPTWHPCAAGVRVDSASMRVCRMGTGKH